MEKRVHERISTKSQHEDIAESQNNLNIVFPKSSVTETFDNRDQGEKESNILVALRVRPLIQKDLEKGDFNIARVEDNLIVVLDPVEMAHEAQNKPILDVLHRSKEQSFAFDKIFGPESHETIYNETCKNLIHPVLNGYNSCVFAYGTTGAGKTYTMLGNQQVPGIMLLTVKDIFETINTHYTDKEFTIIVSYVEIYNETIRDLLVPSSGYLDLRDDPTRGTLISGATEHKGESMEQIMSLLLLGNKRRTTEATNANQTSSRSHAVFQIQVMSIPKTKNIEVETVCGKLSLIDLAGSERGTVTENRGIRLREGAKINRSLLALANCINALGDKAKKGFFVPYRDSKLTRLLKDSLGGNCKTVMIANISPASAQLEETLNTLKYASRAKNIKTKVVSNKKMVSMHIAEYKNIINDLRVEIDELKSKLSEANSGGVQNQPTNNNLPPVKYQLPGQDEFLNSFTINSSYNHREEMSVRNDQQQKHPEDCVCSCGREQDNVQVKRIQEELFENFQQRIQIRRALNELDDQNEINILEMKKKETEIIEWEKTEESHTLKSNRDEDPFRVQKNGFFNQKKRPLSALPDHIKKNYKSIKTLKVSTTKNTDTRNQLNDQLLENIAEAKKIKNSISKRIKHKDRKEYLDLVIKNHLLDLQNVEYELHLKLQEKAINEFKNLIKKQNQLLAENNIPFDAEVAWEESPRETDQVQTAPGLEDNVELNIDDLVYDDEEPHISDDNSSSVDEEEQPPAEKKPSKKELKEVRSQNIYKDQERIERRQGSRRGIGESDINIQLLKKERTSGTGQEESIKRFESEKQKENVISSIGLNKERSQTIASRNLDEYTDRNQYETNPKQKTDSQSMSESTNHRILKQITKNQPLEALPTVPNQPRDRSAFDAKGRKNSVGGINSGAAIKKEDKPKPTSKGSHPLPILNLLREGKLKGALPSALNIYGGAALKEQKLHGKKV
jgi:kinesin family protein 18/19